MSETRVWAAEVPEEPAYVTEVRDMDGDVWRRGASDLWFLARSNGSIYGVGSTWREVILNYGPLTEVKA